MAENIPRRLRRFYRQKENNGSQNQVDSTNETYSEADYQSGFSSDSFELNKQNKKSGPLDRIPSMDYEDLNIDENNLREIKKFERQSNDEALVEDEVEKFKKQYNRMPNQEETDKIAESLYTQLKNNPIEDMSPSNTSGTDNRRGSSRRDQRRQRNQNNSGEEGRIPGQEINEEPIKAIDTKAKVESIKNIISEEPKKKNVDSSEFDLGFGEEGEGELDEAPLEGESIDDMSEMNLNLEGTSCPNCKKSTEKVIYCPKCGTAFCKSCAKKVEGNDATCPKCGTVTKL